MHRARHVMRRRERDKQMRCPCHLRIPYGDESDAQQAGKQKEMRHAAMTPEASVLERSKADDIQIGNDRID